MEKNLTGYSIRYEKTAPLQSGLDHICLKCVPGHSFNYMEDTWLPISWSDKDVGCSYCGKAMTHDAE